MHDLVPGGGSCADSCCAAFRPATPRAVLWLQGITLAWMLVECGISLYAAKAAHSVVLLAFGSDSLVELLSAGVVLLAFAPRLRIGAARASRWAGHPAFRPGRRGHAHGACGVASRR